MKTRTYLLLLIVAALLNTELEGTANIVVIILLCVAMIPVAVRMDRETQNSNKS